MTPKKKYKPRSIVEKLPCDQPGPTFLKVQELLQKQTPAYLRRMQRQLGFSNDYVRQLKRSMIVNPSINRVEAIYEYMTGKTFRL